jgi:ribosomal protein L37E
MATGVEKLCLICKQDCSGKPRTKDDKGRYICQACIDKYGPEKVARIIADTDAFTKPYDDGIDLAAAAAVEAKAGAAELTPDQSCTKCGNFMQTSARICMHCGFDRQEKRVIRTKVEKAKAAPGEKVSVGEASKAAVIWGSIVLSVIMVAAGALALFVPEAIIVAAAILLPISVAYNIFVIVCQFRDGDSIFGWVSIIGLFVGILWLATIYWILAVNHRAWLKWMLAAQVIALVLGGLAFINMPEDKREEIFGEDGSIRHIDHEVEPTF